MTIWDLYRLGVRVDAEDFHFLQERTWHIVKPGYVATTNYDKSKTLLHRLITNAPADKIVNHENGNGLDCRRANLVVCDRTINRLCSEVVGTGVTKSPSGRYVARFTYKRQRLNLGTFDSYDEAFLAKQTAIQNLTHEPINTTH